MQTADVGEDSARLLVCVKDIFRNLLLQKKSLCLSLQDKERPLMVTLPVRHKEKRMLSSRFQLT